MSADEDVDQVDLPNERASVYTQADWDDAAAAGELDAQHVLDRLWAMTLVAQGQPDGGPAGYDADGFMISLRAEGLSVGGGIKLRVWTKDHKPPHVHVERKGRPGFRLDLSTTELIGDYPKDLKSKEFKHIQSVLVENHAILAEWWLKNSGDDVSLTVG